MIGLTYGIAEWGLGVSDQILNLLGRDPTLTNRTDIWAELLALRGDWLVGTGFEGYWMGKRLERIMEVRNINEAHNGYLEVFLTTGSIGVFLFGLWILSIYKNCREAMIKTLVLGRLRMTFFLRY